MKRDLLRIWLPTILLSAYCAVIVLDLVAFWVVAIFALAHTITLWLATKGFEHLTYSKSVDANQTQVKMEPSQE